MPYSSQRKAATQVMQDLGVGKHGAPTADGITFF